jgi:hypothetical protein
MVCLLGLASCQSAEKAAIQPLPPDQPPLSYAELVARGKAQVAAAHEFSYQDRWADMQQAANAMRETAGMLANLKADNVPAGKRADLDRLTREMTEAANALHDSGKAPQDINKTADALRRLHLVVRQLRPE